MDTMKFVADPLKRVGEVEFGMSREKVRSILGEAKEFKKSKYSKNTTDDFGFCHVYYDPDNCCEAIELFGDIEIVVAGEIVFPGSVENIRTIIKDLDGDGYGYLSVKESIGVTESNGMIEAILFGKAGYYAG